MFTVRQKIEGKTILEGEMERYWHNWVLLYQNLKFVELFLELQPKGVSELNNKICLLNYRFNHMPLVIDSTIREGTLPRS